MVNLRSGLRVGTRLLLVGLMVLPLGVLQARSKHQRDSAATTAPIAQTQDAPKSAKRKSHKATDAFASVSSEPVVQRQQRVRLRDMGVFRPLTLRGVEGAATVNMGVRLDEMVESAQLHLIYMLSPALLPGLSHLRLTWNDEVLQTVPVDKDKLGSQQSVDIKIDPRYFADFNRLRFQLIGHYTQDCEAPMHSSLWASISADSYVDLNLRALPIKTDLALLPSPFFDPRDSRPLNLPLVLGARPGSGVLKAAGSVASWMGMLSSYRGAHFQVLEDALPDRHAVVLASNASRPAFLKDLPLVTKPTLRVMAHPRLPGVKLLLLLGQDEAQVAQAAEELVHGKSALSGESMTLNQLEIPARRAAYDAPRWISTQRVVPLGELVPNASDLQVRGTVLSDVVRINTHMAPDLFTWNSKGVPMNLLYRYTPNMQSDHGSLDLSINDQFIRSYPLQAAGRGSATTAASNILLPLFDDSSVQAKSDFKIPAFMIGGDNQLQLTFQIPPADTGRCQTLQGAELRAAIDPQSTIDLTGFHHYLAMPSLAAYANSGFPFTKYADLAETAIVLPNQPLAAELELYLTAVARMSASTGYPGTRFKVLKASELEQARGNDILLVTAADRDGLLAKWNDSMPVLLEKGARSLRPMERLLGGFMDAFRIDTETRLAPAGGKTMLEGQGALAAIAGMESPLDSGRSVVVLTASDAGALDMVAQALTDPGKVQRLHGDLGLIRGEDVESFRINPVFYVGDLPWVKRLWFTLHGHPTLLALFGLISGLLLGFLIYVSLRTMARRRLDQSA